MTNLQCKICNRKFKSSNYLASHLTKSHSNETSLKEYFDKWKKIESDGKCIICSNPTKFYSYGKGYLKCCSKECIKISRQNGFKKYGVNNSAEFGKLDWVKEKIKQTNIKNWGVNCVFKSEVIKKKMRKTWMKKYGTDNPNRNKDIRNKIEQTNLNKYNVKFPLQNELIFKKVLNNCKLSKIYKDTKIYYRSSYELDFLEKYYSKFSLENGPRISYKKNKKDHYYFPDFYIPSLNLIVEIKNSYLNDKDKNVIELKKKATIYNGFNYIIIVDKDYLEFDSILIQIQ